MTNILRLGDIVSIERLLQVRWRRSAEKFLIASETYQSLNTGSRL